MMSISNRRPFGVKLQSRKHTCLACGDVEGLNTIYNGLKEINKLCKKNVLICLKIRLGSMFRDGSLSGMIPRVFEYG